MTEEIKEIIEHIKTYPEKMYCLSEKEKIRILDYITNLQQENERLKYLNALINDRNNNYRCTNEYYKSKCKKAIEYISFVINHYKKQLKTPIEDTYFDSDVNRKGYILSIIAYLQTILDTLNESDENV